MKLTREQIAEALKNGGETFIDGKEVERPKHDRYVVGIESIAIIHLDALENIEDTITTIARVIYARLDLSQIGIWVDKERRMVFIDKVTFFVDREAALAFAKDSGERAIYNLKDDQTIFVEGSE